MIEYVTATAFEHVQITPNLPVDLSPRYPISFSHKCDKFLQVPLSVNNMFGSDLSVIIDVGFGLVTMQNLSLVHSE